MSSLKEAAEYFGVSRQALLEYVKNHLDEINDDGEHVFQTREGKWQFDDVAIQMLTELRKDMPTSSLMNLSSDDKRFKLQQLENFFEEITAVCKNFSATIEEQKEILSEFGDLKNFLSDLKNFQETVSASVKEQNKILSGLDDLENFLSELKKFQEKISAVTEEQKFKNDFNELQTEIAAFSEELNKLENTQKNFLIQQEKNSGHFWGYIFAGFISAVISLLVSSGKFSVLVKKILDKFF